MSGSAWRTQTSTISRFISSKDSRSASMERNKSDVGGPGISGTESIAHRRATDKEMARLQKV